MVVPDEIRRKLEIAVSFRPEETTDGSGTRVTLVESGFASLPDQIEQQSQAGNDEGWAGELRELKEYLEGQ
jgi:hypothetical protein